MQRLTDTQRMELDRLHAETIALVEWFVEHQGFEHGEGVTNAANQARDRYQLGNMRAIAREVRSFIGELPPGLHQLVLAAVEASSGISLVQRSQADAAEAEGILKRGRVRNRAEYDLLRSHAERLSSDPARTADATRAFALLDRYAGSDEAST